MEERSSGFVVFHAESGEISYLLLRSSNDGYWGFPKGKIDPGESDEEAASRELAEETGITDFINEPAFEHTVEYWYARDGRDIHKEVRYYLASVNSKEIRLSQEHSEHGWYDLGQAVNMIAFENLRDVLVKADSFIRER